MPSVFALDVLEAAWTVAKQHHDDRPLVEILGPTECRSSIPTFRPCPRLPFVPHDLAEPEDYHWKFGPQIHLDGST
jgi:hypothetical protein